MISSRMRLKTDAGKGWRNAVTISVSGQGGVHFGYKLTSATTALTYIPSLSAAVAVGTLIAMFK